MRSHVGGRKAYGTTPPPRPCQVRSSSGLESSVATAATKRPTTANRTRRRSPRKVRILQIEEYSNDSLARLESVLAGGLDVNQAPIHHTLAPMADARSRDQALAVAAHARRARGRAGIRLHPQGVLRDGHAAAPVLLHHPPVPAPLGPRDHLRDPGGGPPHLQLREAHSVGVGPIPSREH